MPVMKHTKMVGGVGGWLTQLSAFARRTSTLGKRHRSNRAIIGPPTVTWPKAGDTETPTLSCPNCGSVGPKPLILTVDFANAPDSRKEVSLVRCLGCSCSFYTDQCLPDYAENSLIQSGYVPFYTQQSAGLSLITRPLAQIRAAAGSVYVEVGCGFGFGLDYARHAKNWTVQGIDPSGIAALGQDTLGVSISSRYLRDSEPELAGTCDVIMASETIEHVPSPIGFVRVLRSMLRPGGTLVLTTPDGADLRRETAPDVLISLLSVGLHLIFQTRESLRQILADAGFTHTLLTKDGNSLVAFASDRPLDIVDDHDDLRSKYISYLAARAADFPPEHDLFLAFAGRAFQELVNDGAFEEAGHVRTQIEQACVTRFGRSLYDLGRRTADLAGVPLLELSRQMPLSLGGLLYADGMMHLASGVARQDLGERFIRAAAAADLLRTAIGDLGFADSMSEEIAWVSRAEALLCSAAAGANNVVGQWSHLPSAPSPEDGKVRRNVIAERALVELVNAGHYQRALEFASASALEASPWADPDMVAPRSDSQRDALFCLGVLDSQSHDAPVIERSRARFSRIKLMLETPDGHGGPPGLFEAAARGEVAALERLGGQHSSAASGDAHPKIDG
jgi:SAM-dependent methyltransferase